MPQPWKKEVKPWLKKELINVEKDTTISDLEGMTDPKYRTFLNQTYSVIKNVEEVGLPMPNEQVRLITFRSFNASVFFAYLCQKTTIEHIAISVYSINHEAATLIDRLVKERKIQRVTMLMSNLRNKAHREKEHLTRQLFVNNPNIDLFFAKTHAKIAVTKCACGNYYCLEGSGNMSYNSRIEQYVLDNSKGLYEFTVGWMEEIREYLRGTKELVETGN